MTTKTKTISSWEAIDNPSACSLTGNVRVCVGFVCVETNIDDTHGSLRTIDFRKIGNIPSLRDPLVHRVVPKNLIRAAYLLAKKSRTF